MQDEGSVPALIRLSRVCSTWYKVTQSPSLWRTVDLGTWTKDRFKTEPKLKWLIEHRLQHATEVGLGKDMMQNANVGELRATKRGLTLQFRFHSGRYVGNWKITNVQCVLDKLYEFVPNLVGITLTGWKALTADHLMFLVQNFKRLESVDLSSINVSCVTNIHGRSRRRPLRT